MAIRRSSDPIAFSIAYWIVLLAAVSGLGYYAHNRISVVVKRDYVLQNSNVYMDENHHEVRIPDVIFCLHNARLQAIPHGMNYTRINLHDPTIPTGMSVLTPCADDHDSMIIMSCQNSTWNAATHGGIVSFNFFAHEPGAAGTHFFMFLMPRELNIYKNRTLIQGRNKAADPELRRNFHVGIENSVNMYVYAVPQTIKVLRNDIWGLFGVYNDSMVDYLVTSTVEGFYQFNQTWIALVIPTMELASRQVLLVSAPDAFSSWGGLFSLVFGVFYMLFGSRRMSPFGIIQKYMLRSRTKAMIANIYGNWKRDSSGNYYCRDSEGIPRMEDGIKGGSSYISLGRRASSSADLPLQDRQQVPLPYLPGNTDSSDSSNIVLEQQYMTQFSNTKAASDGNANNVYSLQQQIHHGEFLALRDQVEAHAKILRHLQGHEQRFKDTETLLKEFYLDMDLVDTKALAQDTALLTSTTVENVDTTSNQGKEQSSWRKSLSDGLFRTNQHPVLTRNTSDDSEERIALRESGFAMGFHGNPRADSPKHPNNRPNSSMEMIQYVHEP